MPIKVQRDLPAIKVLESENIFVMPDDRADTQDIRPLRIVILNNILKLLILIHILSLLLINIMNQEKEFLV